MKRTLTIASAIAAALLCQSCAKVEMPGKNTSNKRFFEAWIQVNHPDAQKDESGFYIFEKKTGNGLPVGSVETNPYLVIEYTVTDLDGNITETTDEKIAQQLGTFSEATYYGPVIALRGYGQMKAGLELLLEDMNVGGTKTAAVPGWFDTSLRYDNENDYFNNVTGTDYIYSVKVDDVIPDLVAYQIDSIEQYISTNLKVPADSAMYGYYYFQTQAPSDTTTIEKSGSVYVNYTGKLLNGMVFDTTDEITAKDARIHTPGKTYEKYEVELAEDYTEMDTVQGFSYCVSNMKEGEKGICIFISNLGYGGSAQSSIPAFSPLIFEIEMLGKKK
ncbi:MAG: FKBP-type peptidyl-prolyl cis-trans isomerase [Bacteroidia bacterium]|nr:FKBP-type peptidyl-prolyl cis-trans isomerase [Bacteroidia bacterium]